MERTNGGKLGCRSLALYRCAGGRFGSVSAVKTETAGLLFGSSGVESVVLGRFFPLSALIQKRWKVGTTVSAIPVSFGSARCEANARSRRLFVLVVSIGEVGATLALNEGSMLFAPGKLVIRTNGCVFFPPVPALFGPET